jgi:hypothetical protein
VHGKLKKLIHRKLIEMSKVSVHIRTTISLVQEHIHKRLLCNFGKTFHKFVTQRRLLLAAADASGGGGGPGAVLALDVKVEVAQPTVVDPDATELATRCACSHARQGRQAVVRVELAARRLRQA